MRGLASGAIKRDPKVIEIGSDSNILRGRLTVFEVLGAFTPGLLVQVGEAVTD
jgi:hypothetical protein